MPADVDAVAVYYDTENFHWVLWEDLADLPIRQALSGLVELHVFHTQNAGNNPNILTVTGTDLVAARLFPDGFDVRTGEQPPTAPENSREHFFMKASTQQNINEVLGGPAAAAPADMEVVFRGTTISDDDFEVLRLRALSKSQALRIGTDLPPQRATY